MTQAAALVFFLTLSSFSYAKGGVEIQSIQGEVLLHRAGKIRPLKVPEKLQKGDLLQVKRLSSLSVVGKKFLARVADRTLIKIESTGLRLLFGHLAIVGHQKTTTFLPHAKVIAEKNSEFFLHFFGSKKSYSRSLHQKLARMPSLKEILGYVKSPLSFSWVACLKGRIKLETRRSGKLKMNPGDLVELEGQKGPFTPTAVGVDQIRARANGIFER